MASKISGLVEKISIDSTQHSIASTAYGYCETAAATTPKVVEMTGFQLLEGVTIYIKFKERNNVSNPKLKIKYGDGDNDVTAEIPIVQYATTAVGTGDSTTGWYAGAVVSLTYDGTSWVKNQGFNSDNDATGYYHRRIYPNLKAGTGGIDKYVIIMQLPNGRWSGIVPSSQTTASNGAVSPKATGKTASTNQFMLGHVLLMYANATYADGANVGTYNIWSAYSGLIDARYSFNLENTEGNRFIGYTPVYIVGTVSNGLFTLDSTKWWAQTLPSSEDGKVYIYIGDAYDWYRLTFTEDKPIYWYKDGAVRLYSGASEYALSAPLSGISDADDLKAIEAISGTSGLLKKTAANTWTLDTNSYVTSSGVTKVSTGVGLTGGDITTTGTIKANLTSETKLSNAAADGTETSGRIYPVRLDKNGKLAVNVPWTNINSNYKTKKTNAKELSAAGWYRILDCTQYSIAFFITFYGRYNYQPPTPVTFLVSHAYNTTKIEQIGRSANIGWITQIRAIHHDTSKSYIDVYYAGTEGSNQANFEITPLNPYAQDYITLVDFTPITDTINPNAICSTSLESHADKAEDANTVNGLTVQTAVPANAIFTDTNKYHKTGSWSGLTYTATAVNSADELKFTIPDNYGDTKNPYGTKAKNLVLAGPSSGSNAAPSFRALVAADIPALAYVPAALGANDVNTLVNTGIYNITSGQATNAPKGYGYGQLLVMSYRKHTGNTTTDWASQIYLHNGGGTETGSTTSPGNVLYYRTSGTSSSNSWFSWQKTVHTDAAYTKVGSTNQPVYIAEDGSATAITAVGAAYGGTGKTTLNESANVLINALTEGTSPATANDYLIAQYAGGGTTTTTYHRRKVSNVVNATVVKAALGTVSTTAKKFLKDTGAWTQVDWGDLTGKPSTFTPAAHTHSHLVSLATINSGDSENNTHAAALKKYFDENKSTIPRNSLVNFSSSAYDNRSQAFGYWLSGYNDTPYGGFFVAHYNIPRYVGIVGGTYTQVDLITSGTIGSQSVHYATSAGTASSATTAGAFSSGTTVKLTGDTTGESSSSTKGWSVATTTKYLTGTAESTITSSPGAGKIKYSYDVHSDTEGLFSVQNNANSIITLNKFSGSSYNSQLGFSSNGNIYYRSFNGSALNTTTAWKQLAFTDSTVACATADASGNTITSTYAPLASPALTGTPTAPTAANGTNTTQIATTEFVNNTLAYANAMTFKGTLGTGGTITALPASHNAGDTYRVITAGTWAGKYCEVGTLIICTTDGTAANDAHWTSVETNEDGAVIGATPTSSTDNAIVRWDSTSGRVIQNSGVKIDDNDNIILTSGHTGITNSANKRISWQLSDGTLEGYLTISSEGTVGLHGNKEIYLRPGDDNNTISSSTGVVVTNTAFYPYYTNSITLGTVSKKWATVYANEFNGNATSATIASTITTTNDTTNTLYLTGVTSSATTTLKRNSSISMAGGTLNLSNLNVATGSANYIRKIIDEYRTDGPGWARNLIVAQDSSSNTLFRIGLLGSANSVTYGYLGSGDYSEKNHLRIYPDGTIKVPIETVASSTSTGALQVSGGVGIAKQLYVGTNVNAPSFIATHTAGGYGEFKVQYSNTISYWWGVDTGNNNHGLYDDKAGKWIISAGADNKWSFDGNAATATSATTATSASYLSTPAITTEENIESGTRAYQGSGGNWTGSITSMQYAGILQVCGGYSRGWQIWAQRGDNATQSLHWRNPNTAANAWNEERIILDSGNYTNYTVTKTGTGASGTWGISISGSSASCTGNAATATAIQTAGTTAQFYRGDNSWSNIIKQTANTTLSIDDNLKIGNARKDLNFDIATGSGTGINDGYAGGITWGTGAAAHAGIYCQTSGSYGTRLIFGTTTSYASGAYARMIIQNNGYVGIGTLLPDTLLTVNGNGKFTGQIITSFKSSIAPGSYGSAQTTIPDLLEEVRYSSGCMGSFNLTTAYTLNNVTLAAGWYNFMYIPHRNGGLNGAAWGDNCDYGALYLHRMNAAGYADYVLAYSSQTAKLLDLHASFQSAITDGQILVADGTLGHIKTSGYTASSFAEAGHTHNYAGSSSAGGAANSAVKLSGGLEENDVSTYTNFKLTTAKGGYYGFLVGNSTSCMNVMGAAQHNGLYCQAHGRWITYYDATNDRIAIGSSITKSGYVLAISGKTHINDATVVNGSVSATTISLTNTDATPHIGFSRTGGHTAPNYINVPANSALAVSVGGAAGTNIAVMIENKSINSFNDAETSLGTSTYEWKEAYSKNYVVNKKVKLEYNSTDDSLDFVFI